MLQLVKSGIVRNTTWAQLSIRYGLPAKLLCPPGERQGLESKLKIQADLFEAHIGAFWLSFPENERDSRATPILRAYFRQLLDELFPLFHRVYASKYTPTILPPRPTLVPHHATALGRVGAPQKGMLRGTAVSTPIVIDDDSDMSIELEDMDLDVSDTDDDWFEVIGSKVITITIT